MLTAMGVVYGDIGTSPLYAIRECFHGPHRVPVTEDNVLGVLSLVFWTLIIVVTLKYLLYVIRADNRGEGGILALMALVREQLVRSRPRWFIISLGLIGAGLLYGDGAITPAISVLGAIEGLDVATPSSSASHTGGWWRSAKKSSSSRAPGGRDSCVTNPVAVGRVKSGSRIAPSHGALHRMEPSIARSHTPHGAMFKWIGSERGSMPFVGMIEWRKPTRVRRAPLPPESRSPADFQFI